MQNSIRKLAEQVRWTIGMPISAWLVPFPVYWRHRNKSRRHLRAGPRACSLGLAAELDSRRSVIGCGQVEQPGLVKEAVAPPVVILASGSAFLLGAFSQDASHQGPSKESTPLNFHLKSSASLGLGRRFESLCV